MLGPIRSFSAMLFMLILSFLSPFKVYIVFFPVLITIPCAVLHVELIIFAIYYLWHCLLCAIHTHC